MGSQCELGAHGQHTDYQCCGPRQKCCGSAAGVLSSPTDGRGSVDVPQDFLAGERKDNDAAEQSRLASNVDKQRKLA